MWASAMARSVRDAADTPTRAGYHARLVSRSDLPPPEQLRLVPLADIARGGMGVVQLAQIDGGRLDRRVVAVKRLSPEVDQDPEFVNMFLDETWMTAAIASPHVVRVESWGRDDVGMYLAVELVQGVSLSRLMKESRAKKEPFAERTVAFILSQVCAGLAAAHALRGRDGQPLGLVHRDLTPGNILVGFDGVVKIADFGIAKAQDRLTSTRIGTMKGKPAYMAPEQARGGTIDLRADLFSVGVVAFELLGGRRPWLGDNDLEMLLNVTTKPPTPLAEVRKVSPVFEEVVMRCLERDPERRFASADEIRARLDAWRAERGFDRDDQASLAAFVQRNTPQQMAWFQQALSGGYAGGGETFADIEARIDQRRKAGKTTEANFRLPPELRQPTPASGTGAVELEEIDENARTRFMDRGPSMPAAPPAPAPTAAPTLPSPGSSGRAVLTLAMTPEESAAMSAKLPGPPSPRPAQLPLPPPRSNPGLGAPPSSLAVPFPPPSSGRPSGPFEPSYATPISAPSPSGPSIVQAPGSGPTLASAKPSRGGIYVIVVLAIAVGLGVGLALAFRARLGF
jgi:serine/threonine protein kinase